MKIENISRLPIDANVCNQMLRVVVRIPDWTLAHVAMNPEAQSLLHVHRKMTELYVVTRGRADLQVGTGQPLKVRSGNVIRIDPDIPHQTLNTSLGSFQHLVLASPPFDPKDVELLPEVVMKDEHSRPDHALPERTDCFDGARIIPYNFPDLKASFAFGSVVSDPSRRKQAHYHKKTTEWILVLEGSGFVEIDDVARRAEPNDWIQVDPGEAHALRNINDEHMTVLCVCNPAFDMGDVHYK